MSNAHGFIPDHKLARLLSDGQVPASRLVNRGADKRNPHAPRGPVKFNEHGVSIGTELAANHSRRMLCANGSHRRAAAPIAICFHCGIRL